MPTTRVTGSSVAGSSGTIDPELVDYMDALRGRRGCHPAPGHTRRVNVIHDAHVVNDPPTPHDPPLAPVGIQQDTHDAPPTQAPPAQDTHAQAPLVQDPPTQDPPV
ncbi:hypothetical protein V6N13_104959 [Hibiscus sabdariffa]